MHRRIALSVEVETTLFAAHPYLQGSPREGLAHTMCAGVSYSTLMWDALLLHVLMALIKCPPSTWAHSDVNNRFRRSSGVTGRFFCAFLDTICVELGFLFIAS